MQNKKHNLLFIAFLSIILILSACGAKQAVDPPIEPKVSVSENGADVTDKEGKDLQEEPQEKLETEHQAEKGQTETKGQETDQTVNKKPNSNEGNLNKNNKVNTEKSYSTQNLASKDKNAIATISITGPDDIGAILRATEIELEKSDSVIDLLEKVTAKNNIHLDIRGSGLTAYVKGIGHVYEFDRGAKSGWLYKVNGKTPGESAGTCIIKAGDRVEWIYTIDLGRDLN